MIVIEVTFTLLVSVERVKAGQVVAHPVSLINCHVEPEASVPTCEPDVAPMVKVAAPTVKALVLESHEASPPRTKVGWEPSGVPEGTFTVIESSAQAVTSLLVAWVEPNLT